MEGSPQTESIDASAYYIWEVPGRPVTIYLSHEAIDGILGEAGKIPDGAPSDAEAGGLLLGVAESGDRLVVRIEGAAPLAIRYTFGPSYLLAEEDQASLRAALDEWAPGPDRAVYAVGFFRTHRRSGLGLTQDDLWLFENYFSDPYNVAMLIKPRPVRSSLAGFFFWEQNEIRAESSYLEFPIRPRRALRQPEPPPAAADPAPVPAPAAAVPAPPPPPPPRDVPLPGFLAGAPEAPEEKRRWWKRAPRNGGLSLRIEEPPAPEPEPLAEPEPESVRPPWWKRLRRSRTEEAPAPAAPPPPAEEQAPETARPGQPLWVSWWILTPMLTCLWLVMGLLGYAYAQQVRTPPPYALEAPRDPYALSLLVVEYGENLCLTWDRHAPAIRLAQRAVLQITDGENSRSIQLEPHMLRDPDFGVTYHRVSGNVRFRLEVVLSDERTLSETWDLASHTKLGTSSDRRPARR
jgi:hypothetical protein